MHRPQILKKMNAWFRTPREPDITPVEFDRSDWIPEIRRRLSAQSTPVLESMKPLPRCFSCGELFLRVVQGGRGARIGPMRNGTYDVGCVVTHETPKYICSGCGFPEGLFLDQSPESAEVGEPKLDEVMPTVSNLPIKLSQKKRDRTGSGRRLAQREGLNVKKAYYHWEGTFFQRVHEFPVALFDRYGYVVLSSQTEYLNHPKIAGIARTNIPSGIDSFPTYKKMRRPAF
jgi:hypothetical protein